MPEPNNHISFVCNLIVEKSRYKHERISIPFVTFIAIVLFMSSFWLIARTTMLVTHDLVVHARKCSFFFMT